ncbi:ester cyclase [Photobacterium sp. 1_MG-2023]|uniref:ester cyclase n=1 Tax=Photobacterium sp. 1_MG-2023 TaxID=3062646 RepID=UPI0026E2057A|nr:ester cyclase [Photobacterium sp. 1_MG-2023]MDO6707969.1 ester cyclase [Photobacterium sp. 1_MG-2023]
MAFNLSSTVAEEETMAWIDAWFLEIWTNASSASLSANVADPFTFHLPGGRRQQISHDSYLTYLQLWRQKFKSLTFSIADVISQPPLTVVRYRCQAQYQGGWLSIPGKKQVIQMTGMIQFRHEEGQISECWLEDSSFDLYQQLTGYLK